MDNFSRTQIIRKAVIPTRGGVVAAAHRRAAEVGASVLDAGGDAVDAAVAVSFAIGVVEPWMSGPAAGGAMVLWRAGEGRARVVDYGMRSPMALDPADYPLTGGGADQGSLRLARGAGRPQRAKAPPPSRCRAWSPAWASPTRNTAACPGATCSRPP